MQGRRREWFATAFGLAAGLLTATSAAAEPGLTPQTVASDLAFEPQLVCLGGASLGQAQVSVVAPMAGGWARRFQGFALPSVSLTQSLYGAGPLALQLAPAIEFVEHGGDMAFALPLALSLSEAGLFWSTELGYRSAPGGDEWTMDGSVGVELRPGLSVNAAAAVSAQPDLRAAQALLSGSLTWLLSDDIQLAAGYGQGLRDAPFSNPETLAMAHLARVW